jgi:Ni/Fe-hydrogenase subunit HybB-like protein
MRKELVPGDVIDGVARFIGFACLAYLYLKLWSWAATNYYSHVPEQAIGAEILAQHTPYNFTFWFGEVLFGALVPAMMLLWPRLRANRNVIMLAAIMIAAGLIINRWNMTLSGFVVPLDWSPGTRDVFPINLYEPALVEWGVALFIVAYFLTAYTLAVRFLNIYPAARDLAPAPRPVPVTPPVLESATNDSEPAAEDTENPSTPPPQAT